MYSETFLRVIRYDTRHHSPFEHAPGKRMVEFRQHIRDLSREFEMASMQSALDFLDGSYHPRRNQCLLTFDCGWREHYTDATPILSELRISGVFSVITSCLEERTLPVSHMREYLLETLGFDEFASDFFRKVVSSRPDAFAPLNIDIAGAAELYPTELPEVGRFKYLLEFGMDHELRDRAVRSMFADWIGDGAALADSLYIGWEEARSMQAEGMVIGGHAHRHAPLAYLSAPDLMSDLETCYTLLRRHLRV